jgi:DNA-binding SARP family transcriptional activator
VALDPAGGLLRAETAHLALSDDGLHADVAQILCATPAQPGSLELWRGGMLADLIGLDSAFDQWLGEQQRCLWSRGRAVGELILAEAESTAAIVVAAERLLVIDSTHEDGWRFLIRCHIECGDRVAAIGTYERCCAALSAQCQVGPSAEATALVAALRVRPTTLTSVSRVRDVAVEVLRRRVADSLAFGSASRPCVAPLRAGRRNWRQAWPTN